jgi:hypothetical protein
MVHASTAYESLARLGNFSLVIPTLAITWPQGVLSEEDDITAAAQVHGGVR